MYEFKYYKSEFRVQYNIHKIVEDTTIVYYFYLITESFQDDENCEAPSQYIIEWSRTSWDKNELRLNDVDYRAIVDYSDFISISLDLCTKEYDKVFDQLEKLENVRVTKYKNG